MRIVAYDISGFASADVVGEVLATCEADVVGLISAPAGRDLRAISRAAGLEIAAKASLRGVSPAILIRPGVRVRSTERLALATSRGSSNRLAAHAIVGIGGMSASVVAVDLGLRAEVRAHNINVVTDFLATVATPSVIAASLHTSAGSALANAIEQGWQDAFVTAGTGPGDTFPAAEPVARHDAILVDSRLQVTTCRVDDGAEASSACRHRAVIADCQVRVEFHGSPGQ